MIGRVDAECRGCSRGEGVGKYQSLELRFTEPFEFSFEGVEFPGFLRADVGDREQAKQFVALVARRGTTDFKRADEVVFYVVADPAHGQSGELG